MKDPDSPDFYREEKMSPQEVAFRSGSYTPGIISWLAGIEREQTVGAIRAKSDDIAWQEAAIADLDKARGYEDTALTRLHDSGIQIPTDDVEYTEIVQRQLTETIERL